MFKERIQRVLNSRIKQACDKNGLDYTKYQDNPDLDLLESGMFDSLGFLELITSLENELNIEIDLSEYDPAEFILYHRLVRIIYERVKN